MPRKQDETGGVSVQSADSVGGEPIALLLKVERKRVAQCVIVVSLRWMNRHTGGFVEHKQVLILVDNVERQIGRHDIIRGRQDGKIDTQHLSRTCTDDKINRLAVQTDASRDLFQTDEKTAGESVLPKNILHRCGIAFRRDENSKGSSSFHEDSVS